MLGHFPNPHPDELLYGVCARLSERANVPSKKRFCQSPVWGRLHCVVDLPSRLEFLANQLPSGGLRAETLLRNHTLLPLYLPFPPKERAEKCKPAALGDGGKSLPFLTDVRRARSSSLQTSGSAHSVPMKTKMASANPTDIVASKSPGSRPVTATASYC
jgi:hypothetical protein